MYTNFCSCVSTLTTLSTGYLVRTYNVLTFLSNQHILAKLSSFFSPADDNNENDNEPNWSLYCQLSWLVGGAVNNPRDNQLINWTTGGVISAL